MCLKYRSHERRGVSIDLLSDFSGKIRSKMLVMFLCRESFKTNSQLNTTRSSSSSSSSSRSSSILTNIVTDLMWHTYMIYIYNLYCIHIYGFFGVVYIYHYSRHTRIKHPVICFRITWSNLMSARSGSRDFQTLKGVGWGVMLYVLYYTFPLSWD